MSRLAQVNTATARDFQRRRLIADIRPRAQVLGARFVREFGSPRYGRNTMAELTDTELLEVHRAALAAMPALPA
jgi:hypothetical protein